MTRVPNQSVQPTGGSRFAQRGFWRQTVDWSGLRVLRDSGLVKRKGRSLPPPLAPSHDAAWLTKRSFNYTNLWDASVKFMRPRRSDKTLLHVLKAKGDCVAGRQFETAMSGWRGAGSDRQLDGLVLRQNQLSLAAGRQLQYQLALPWLSP
jgi:hypothetical protein